MELGAGMRFVPIPLFAALDGSDPADYVERVEPSARGGRKMARLLLDAIVPPPQPLAPPRPPPPATPALSAAKEEGSTAAVAVSLSA